MSASGDGQFPSMVAATIQQAEVPGMVIALWQTGAPITYVVSGTDAMGQVLEETTLFPVTSLTKLALALSILRLCDQGIVHLEDPLYQYVPEAQAAQPGVTLRTLLTHTSGLPSLGWPEELAPYGPGLTWPRVAQASLQVALSRPPHQRVVYAGADANLLALVAERTMHMPFREVLQTQVLHPLGIDGYFGEVPPRLPAQIAPRTGDEWEPWNSSFWQALGLPGSGLVTTAEGMMRILHAFLGHPAGYLRDELRHEALRNQTGTLGGGVEGWFDHTPCPWGLGPGLQGSFPNVPSEASVRSFGHSGGSGCLAWADPERQVAWVILSTRAAEMRWPDRAFPRLGAAILTLLAAGSDVENRPISGS